MDEKGSAGFSASDVDAIVGERIRRRRILTGQTQDQLGDALGVSYQQIQKYETGANRVSAGRLYLLAEQLDVSPSWFFDGLSSTESSVDEDMLSSSRMAIECVRNLSRIKDEKVRSSILTMIRTLAESEEETDADGAILTTSHLHKEMRSQPDS
ncbi:helix-turn-helix transcriptional regulator [Henriciella sp.]|uniref:helix-turn-helix domain-containing protein n=1 Tax=Henriciella sp. TaxID=1968823 RepID=UPI00261784E7|nr:helix-turn-helix transcriptional regulator [Henriciella sp.]